MFNDFTFNENEIGFSVAPLTLAQDDIVFNGYSLQSATFLTSEIDYDDQKNIELNTFKFPRIDGGGVLSKFYRGRTITIRGTLKVANTDTAADFNTLIDEVKKNLRATEGNLDIKVNGEVRRIKATVTNIDVDRKHYNITFAPIVVTFMAMEPFFYSIINEYGTFVNKNGNFTESMAHDGSADVIPNAYYIFGAGTSATAMTITDANGRILTITTAITNGTVIYIDGENRTVKKDGVEIDFTWSFPIFAPGVNTFTTAFTGTVLCDVTYIAKKNYL